jgi:iron-sulfur cluster assembly accessory protein
MDAPSVVLTDRAARRIETILAGEPSAKLLRIAVAGGGCSGFQYTFDLGGAAGEDDLVLCNGKAVVAIDEMSLTFLAGAEIDYVDDLIGASFQIKNPNATAACGCGTSFSV